jgi:hypothetical protein
VPHPLGILTGVNLNGDSCDVFHNIFLDPLFVDSNDYHLTPGSPCIDAGNPAYQLDPDSTITDMGFFYFDQSAFVSQISSSQIPRGFSLSAPRPNPFNSSTILMFTLTEQIKVSLIIYNLLGQEVLKVADGVKEAGVYRFRIDGDALPSGIYFAFLKAENQQRGQKLLLLK